MDEKNIGAFICSLRKEKNMTQKQLAMQLGITDKAVSKWERGLSYPDITLLEPLAQLFGVTTGELLGGARVTVSASAETSTEALELHVQVQVIEETQKAVDEVLEYSKKSIHRNTKQLKNIVLVLWSACCLIGIGVCFICDFAVTGSLWWSLIVTASVFYGWGMVVPLLTAGRKPIFWSLVVASVSILPYLWILGWLVGEKYLMTMGTVVALESIAFVWIVYYLFKKLGHRLWLAFGIFFVSAVAACVIINVTVNAFLGQPPVAVNTFMNSAAMLILAAVCFGIEYMSGRMKHNA